MYVYVYIHIYIYIYTCIYYICIYIYIYIMNPVVRQDPLETTPEAHGALANIQVTIKQIQYIS